MEVDVALGDLLSLQVYQQDRAHVFPSKHALEWFARKHRVELVDCGALLVLAGKRFVNPPLFDRCAVAIGRRLATARVSG